MATDSRQLFERLEASCWEGLCPLEFEPSRYTPNHLAPYLALLKLEKHPANCSRVSIIAKIANFVEWRGKERIREGLPSRFLLYSLLFLCGKIQPPYNIPNHDLLTTQNLVAAYLLPMVSSKRLNCAQRSQKSKSDFYSFFSVTTSPPTASSEATLSTSKLDGDAPKCEAANQQRAMNIVIQSNT